MWLEESDMMDMIVSFIFDPSFICRRRLDLLVTAGFKVIPLITKAFFFFCLFPHDRNQHLKSSTKPNKMPGVAQLHNRVIQNVISSNLFSNCILPQVISSLLSLIFADIASTMMLGSQHNSLTTAVTITTVARSRLFL